VKYGSDTPIAADLTGQLFDPLLPRELPVENSPALFEQPAAKN
jgi:hypothetical protein